MSTPQFVRGSALLEGAYGLARGAHHGPRRRGDTDIDHPVEVAELLHGHGFGDEAVAAALLHDVVEDTSTDIEEIRIRFGPEVAALVERMTEDQSIERYEERKAEHRDRVVRDRHAAAIYAADKLANTRAVSAGTRARDERRLDHYVATVRALCRSHPRLPFLGELREELERVGRDPARG